MAYQSINPNHGKRLKSFEHLSNAQLDEVLAAAETWFQTWKHKPYAERAAILTKAAALLHAHVDDFARLETLEMRKRIHEARGEVKFSGDILAYYAKHAESFIAPAKLHLRVTHCPPRTPLLSQQRQPKETPCTTAAATTKRSPARANPMAWRTRRPGSSARVWRRWRVRPS